MKAAFILKEVIGGVTLDYEFTDEGKSLLIPKVYPDLASAMADIMVIRKHGERAEFSIGISYDYIYHFELRTSRMGPLICIGRENHTHQKVKKVLEDFCGSLAEAEVAVYA
jgi:hypothetical protein